MNAREQMFVTARPRHPELEVRDLVRLAREQAAAYRQQATPHLTLACLALVLHALVLAQVRDPEGDR